MQKVISVQALANYRLTICFEDGLEGVVDLTDLVGKGVFAAWVDPEEFSKVSIDPITHTVAWPGGIDLCPDSLREEIAAREEAA